MSVIDARETIDIYEAITNDTDSHFFYATKKGVLIGKGLTIDEMVEDAERNLKNEGNDDPNLFSGA